MAKYRPDQPAGLTKRLSAKDRDYVHDLELSVQYYGDEYNKLLDRSHAQRESERIARQELTLHRTYLAVMANIKGCNIR